MKFTSDDETLAAMLVTAKSGADCIGPNATQ